MTQHASSSSAQPEFEPSHAERARTLLVSEKAGTLATQSRHHPGWPYASVMPYALTEEGAPIFLISSMAVHTQNLLAEPRASLLVQQSGAEDPLASPRGTLLGIVSKIDNPTDAVRASYLQRHPSAKSWIEFSDFSFFRLDVTDVYYIGGFGVMGWVTGDEYRSAEPDPLMTSSAQIIEHMNSDHADALLGITRHFGRLNAEEASMIAVDRLGFIVRAKTAEGTKGIRIPFPEPVRSREDARRVLVAMTKQARGD